MSCCDGCNNGYGCDAGGLGAIPQQMPAIAGGSPFQFGYNVGYFRNELYDPAEIGNMLENEEGLAYDARSYVVAGYLNPYLTVEGNAVTTWNNAADLGQAIYNAISSRGYPIDYSSIQFRVEPYYPPTAPGQQPARPPAMVGTPYPTTNPTIPRDPSGGCSFQSLNLPDWLACQLGVTPTTALVVGGVGALILFVALTRGR